MADIGVTPVERHILWELFFSATELPPPYTAVKTLTFLMGPFLGRMPTEREMLALSPPKEAYREVRRAVRRLEREGLVESAFLPYVAPKGRGGLTRRPHKWVRLTEEGLNLGESLWKVHPWELDVHHIPIEEVRGSTR